jgi:hypothetical protein
LDLHLVEILLLLRIDFYILQKFNWLKKGSPKTLSSIQNSKYPETSIKIKSPPVTRLALYETIIPHSLYCPTCLHCFIEMGEPTDHSHPI